MDIDLETTKLRVYYAAILLLPPQPPRRSRLVNYRSYSLLCLPNAFRLGLSLLQPFRPRNPFSG
ncbi:hypothetical protein I7I50_10333 [Histoplasma capsulatum G186AR]|uniref:Uncharacterized protein n=1 Tax=Ajellomyces capsulatus TaxID=5037 RepID=A0A8H7Z3L9_AJECA|nr:hypothetical protein I7I52_01572 [Histoplasma capsulatum]QSS69147.1 hypothetical protein I7I50_10333 [Histoplasma capsulatum G186AR]